MKKIISVLLATMLCSAVALSAVMTTSAAFNQEAKPKKGDTVAILHTNYGDIAMSFFPKYAPKGVENFQTLAKDGKYDNTIFHRIIKDFMIQGGDYTNGDGTGGESCWGEDFENECVDELSNIRGSVAYANSGADTNGSQFYINSVDNSASLDGSYTVFGQVFAGMDVVDLISDCEKTLGSDGNESSPVNTVELKSVDIEEYTTGMEDDLVTATDPYEGQESTSADSTTSAGDDAQGTTEATDSSDDEPFNFIPIIVTVGVLAVIFACFAIPYGIQDKKKKKAKAEAKAAMKANPDYKKKKSTKKRK
ncbi:MAG: peptidylprolyl isomerase [Ruminococcus sp.]